MFADLLLKNVIGVGGVATSVDNGKLFAIPEYLAILAVASHARSLVHNGLAAANQTVEEGGLAHIGATYNCYNVTHWSNTIF